MAIYMTELNVSFEPPAPAGGPHSDSPRARLIEAGSPAYILVGGILRKNGAGDDEPFDLLIAPGVTREFDAFFRPMLQFFRVARTEEQALEWLSCAGAPEDALKDMLETGLVVRIDTTDPVTAARSFKGIRIIPQSVPGEPAPSHPTQISVRRDPGSPISTYVPIELSRVLWALDKPLDLTTAIKRMYRQSDLPLDRVARRVLTNMPDLLAQGLARLEWQHAPRRRHLLQRAPRL
jgi:hypothetical protein